MTGEPVGGGFWDPDGGRLLRAFPEGGAFERSGGQLVRASLTSPYIEYPVMLPDFSQSVIAITSVYTRNLNSPGNVGYVSRILKQIADAIPEGGIVLQLDDDAGAIWLQRGRGQLMSTMGDPGDSAITKGIVNLTLRGHVL